MPTLPQAIIFDLDGTLLDTLDDIGDAANAVLQSLNCPTHPRDAYRKFVGDGVSTLMQRALPEPLRSTEQAAMAADRFGNEYDTRWDKKTRAYAGIAELLADIVARGIKMGVLSNKPQRFTEVCVNKWFGDAGFDPVFGQREGIPRKPDPAGVFEMISYWKLEKKDVWYVGDSSVDMQTATSAGVTAVGVSWGFRDREELISYGADRVIDRPEQLLRI
jgi:phosphoglycolate phosphatase